MNQANQPMDEKDQSDIQVFGSAKALAQAAAELILEISAQEIQHWGFTSLVLSGGSTPRAVYRLLSHPDYAERMDWERVFVFWGDERCVPPDHKSSNYHMAWDTLLSKVPIPTQNLYRIRGELEPTKAARAYLRELRHFFGLTQQRYGVSAAGVFSLILLGLGEDGHTASIFPDSLAYEEREQWVVALEHDRPPPPLAPRVTITLPVINAARNVVFLVSGKAKAGRVAQVLAEVGTNPPLPAQLVRPHHGRLTWLLNKYAASTWRQAQS